MSSQSVARNARGFQEEAARIAGLDRTEFILTLAREKVEVIYVDMDELRREWAGE